MALYLAAPRYGGAVAHNRVIDAEHRQNVAMCLADSLKRALEDLQREFGRVVAVADFGCANDPVSLRTAWDIEARKEARPLKLVS